MSGRSKRYLQRGNYFSPSLEVALLKLHKYRYLLVFQAATRAALVNKGLAIPANAKGFVTITPEGDALAAYLIDHGEIP
jgi:hypothetical protein